VGCGGAFNGRILVGDSRSSAAPRDDNHIKGDGYWRPEKKKVGLLARKAKPLRS